MTIEAGDRHSGSGTLSPLFNKPGLALSVRNLLELISDNSAIDVLLRLAGGPKAVTGSLIADYVGASNVPHESDWSLEMWRAKFATAAERFQNDRRDTATPADMARLLVRIQKRELHKPAGAELLADILRRCQTGDARLKGLLPEGTVVAHKTGSIGPAVNDAGIVTLPAGAGHVALAMYVNSADKPTAARERAIAEIARAVHDFFLFQ